MGNSKNEMVGERPVDIHTNALADAITESDEYKEYLFYRARVMEQPELYAKVCEYRKRNFELQNEDFTDNMYDEIMRFQVENSSIRKNALVNSFLKAELSVCRMMQDIHINIMNKIDFDIEFLK